MSRLSGVYSKEGSAEEEAAESASEEKDEQEQGTAPGKGHHSAHCDSCGFGFSKVGMDHRPHEKAVQHAMSKGHTVHYIHHKTGRAAAIYPKGHLSERGGY